MPPSSSATDLPDTSANPHASNGKFSSSVHHLFKRKSSKKGKEVLVDPPQGEVGGQEGSMGDHSIPSPEQQLDAPMADAEPTGAVSQASSGEPTVEGPSAAGDEDNPPGSTSQDSAGQDPNSLSTQPEPEPSPSPPSGTVEPRPSLLAPEQEHAADDASKDMEGSANTTLTASQTHTHSGRKADAEPSTSEGAQSSTIVDKSTFPKSANNSKTASSRSRRSLLSRLVRVLLPCVPSHKTHDVDSNEAPVSDPGAGQKEKEGLAEGANENEKNPKTTVPESLDAAAKEVVSEGPSGPPPLPEPLVITPPTPPDDPSVIVPPTPTKLLPEAETEGVTSGAVQPPGSTGDDSRARTHEHDGDESDRTSFTEDEEGEDVNAIDEVEDEEDRLIMQGGAGIPVGPDGVPRPLLPPVAPQHVGRKCLVLDLDETLVHSSFKSIQQADYVVPVEIEYHWHNVYVIKRPGVDNFLKKMGEIYEVVVFTASLSKYADPVLDKLDIHRVVSHRLFRESCYNHRGNYVKDLSQLGRPIADTIILDNSPASYIFHPNNAVPVSSWFNDPHDTELTDLCPFLADLAPVEDVRGVLDGGL